MIVTVVPRRRHADGSIIQALHEAQKIAFSPFVFQAVVTASRLGLFKALLEAPEGLDENTLARKTSQSTYAVGVLVDVLAAGGVLERSDAGNLRLTKTGECLALDPMTLVNLNFTADVCYRALAHLTESLQTGRPEGLRELGPWETIYPALSVLPEPAKTSWFAFDHYYSDRYLEKTARQLEEAFHPSVLYDIGGNTGKFAAACLRAMPQAQIGVIDLPEQCALAQANPQTAAYGARFETVPVNWLDSTALPTVSKPADILWMSQFLDCFSHEQAVSILKRAQTLLAPGGRIAVLECLTDTQPYEAAALSLAATSLYFTAVANGCSRFFRRADLETILAEAGLVIEQKSDGYGVSHTLYVCRPAAKAEKR